MTSILVETNKQHETLLEKETIFNNLSFNYLWNVLHTLFFVSVYCYYDFFLQKLLYISLVENELLFKKKKVQEVVLF